MVLAPDCNSNFILLGQLQESSIIYYDNSSIMTLIRSNQTIIYVKRSYNHFTPDLIILGQHMLAISKAMTIIGQGWLTHLVSRNKGICLWYQ